MYQVSYLNIHQIGSYHDILYLPPAISGVNMIDTCHGRCFPAISR